MLRSRRRCTTELRRQAAACCCDAACHGRACCGKLRVLQRTVEPGTGEQPTAVLPATMAMPMLTQLKAMPTQLEAVMAMMAPMQPKAMEAELPEPMASCQS